MLIGAYALGVETCYIYYRGEYKYLIEIMDEAIEELTVVRKLMVPYSDSKAVSKLYAAVDVLERNDGDEGTTLVVKVPADKLSSFEHEYGSFIGLASA